jgi:hypothetical protein
MNGSPPRKDITDNDGPVTAGELDIVQTTGAGTANFTGNSIYGNNGKSILSNDLETYAKKQPKKYVFFHDSKCFKKKIRSEGLFTHQNGSNIGHDRIIDSTKSQW